MRFLCAPDEESEEIDSRSTDVLVRERLRGRLRDHRRADRPARRRPGQGRAGHAARGPRHAPRTARRRGWATTRCSRRSTSSARSSPCRSRASPPSSSTAPRSTSAASAAATRSTRSPTTASMDVDIRYLPGQDPGEILEQIRAIAGRRGRRAPSCARRRSSRARTRSCVALCDAVGTSTERRGDERRPRRRLRRRSRSSRPASRPSSSAPPARGHHGPDEWVSIESLARYRQALVDFVRHRARRLERRRGAGGLRAVEGGLA